MKILVFKKRHLQKKLFVVLNRISDWTIKLTVLAI